jgi:uncharacterized protein (TIGR02147 family)
MWSLTKGRSAGKLKELKRPDIFQFNHYRPFLKDWFAFLRENQADFSLKRLAQYSGIASGYLPMVLSGKRVLSRKAFDKLAPHLSLSTAELNHLENLIRIEGSATQEAKLLVFDRIKRSASFQKHNPVAAELLEYMSSWYHIAIREMTALKDFKLDARWIRERLNFEVPIKQIEDSLEFLIRTGHLKIEADGTVAPPREGLRADGEFYKAALTTYHRQMFRLAAEAIDNTPSQERNLVGYSFALKGDSVDRAKEIMARALDEIKKLEKGDSGSVDSVYHFEMALFPLSKRGNHEG